MKRFFIKFIAVLCVVALMPIVAFGETTQNDTEEQETNVQIEKINDSGMTDEELAELEAKFDEYVAASKEKKKLGYPGNKMSIPDSIAEEEQYEIMPYAGDDNEEVEPNDTMGNADRTYVDDYMYGTIEDRYDVDYFKIKFSESG